MYLTVIRVRLWVESVKSYEGQIEFLKIKSLISIAYSCILFQELSKTYIIKYIL